MNIIFLLGDASAKGGIEKVTITLASAMAKTIDCKIISLYKNNKNEVFNTGNVDIEYLKNKHEVSMYNRQYPFLIGYFFDFFYIIYKSYFLRKKLNKSGSVIVTCDIKMTLLALISNLFNRNKIVTIEHFEYDVPHGLLKYIRKKIYRYLDSIVILTNEDKDKYYWYPKKKLYVIPNIVSVVKSKTEITRNNSVLAVGRYTHQKGFDLLIEAWSFIESKYPDWNLKIYGEGEEKNKLNKLIFDYSLKNVELVQFEDNIDLIYERSKVFVLSSRFEGLGMVLIEALAHKLTCVSFDCPAGPKTIIKDDYNGLLVPTGNVIKLAEAIELVLSNKILRDKYSNNALSSISIFSEDIVLDQWNTVFERLNNESL